jgi:hypothetical protein
VLLLAEIHSDIVRPEGREEGYYAEVSLTGLVRVTIGLPDWPIIITGHSQGDRP